jgi:hypothetical protein
MWFEQTVAWLTAARVETITISLVSAIIGTAGGAYAGALAAQKIGKRAADRQATEQLMRDVNKAIHLAYSVANPCINMKEQYVQPIAAEYEVKYATAHHLLRRIELGQLSPTYPVHLGAFRFNTVEPQRPPVAKLEHFVLETIPTQGRLQSLAIVISQALASLNTLIEEYNDLIREYRDQDIAVPKQIARLFAVKLPNGDVDSRFRDTVRMMRETTDATIFFSYLLCTDLQEFGQDLRRNNPVIFRGLARRVVRVDFSPAIAKGLVPSIDQFPDWKAGFVGAVGITKGRRLGRLRWQERRRLRRALRWLGWEPMGRGDWRHGSASRRARLQSITSK